MAMDLLRVSIFPSVCYLILIPCLAVGIDLPSLFFNYDIVRVQASRSKRSADEEQKVDIFGQKRNFSLNLRRRDDLVEDPNAIVDGRGVPIQVGRSRAMSGELQNEANSYVHGIYGATGFELTIYTGNGTFYLEPITRYESSNPAGDDRYVLYERDDVRMKNMNDLAKAIIAPTDKEMYVSDYVKDGSYIFPERRTRSLDNSKNTCLLKVFADQFFTAKWGKLGAVDQILRHYQSVEYIFRKKTFGVPNTRIPFDYSPEGIGFKLKQVVLYDDSDAPEYMKTTNLAVETYLDLFSGVNHQDACLAVLFTYRTFEGGILGLAWLGSPNAGSSGGICSAYVNFANRKSRNFNTAVVTQVLYGSTMPSFVSEITLAHEIGHSFGSPHDPAACSPGEKSGGNYIMFDKATSGRKENHRTFSDCSLRSMTAVIDRKGRSSYGCFVDVSKSICGNRLVEQGETCDCGSSLECKESCCFSSTHADISRRCTLTDSAACSPSQGPCCSNNTCRFASPTMICAEEADCTEASYCRTNSASCPLAKKKPDRILCDGDRGICLNGACTGSVCELYGMEACQCLEFEGMCQLCCKEPGDSKPCISSFNLPQVSDKVLRPGSPCNNSLGYCDMLGYCQPIDMSGPLANLIGELMSVQGIKNWFARNWWVLLIVLVVLGMFTGAMIKLLLRYTPSSNPLVQNKSPNMPLLKRNRKPAEFGVAV